MDNAPRPPETGTRLLGMLKKLLNSPLLKLFTTVKDASIKERFLVCVALTLTSLEDQNKFLWMVNVEKDLPNMSQQLQSRFFFVEESGNVMNVWMKDRIDQYNKDLQHVINQSLN